MDRYGGEASASSSSAITSAAEIAIAVFAAAVGISVFVLALRSAMRAHGEQRALATRERKALDEALAELAHSRKLAAIGRLTGGIAHDFNNLLQLIGNDLGLLDACLQGGDMNVNGYLNMAKRSVARASAVTQRLLTFSRQEVPAPTAVDPNGLVRETVELLRPSFEGKVHIRLQLGATVGRVLTDANELETALLNLAANARDAMRKPGELTFATSSVILDESHATARPQAGPGRYVVIAVTDTGVGMSREVIDQAFDPFFTTKRAGEGTGLGLSQVMDFIRGTKGHIEIQSEPEVGTTVRLFLPQMVEVSGVAGLPEQHVAREPAPAATDGSYNAA
jgi:signal transduction histidine kinase